MTLTVNQCIFICNSSGFFLQSFYIVKIHFTRGFCQRRNWVSYSPFLLFLFCFVFLNGNSVLAKCIIFGNGSEKQKNCMVINTCISQIYLETNSYFHRSYNIIQHRSKRHVEAATQLSSYQRLDTGLGHYLLWCEALLSVCIEVVLVPSGLSPVSGLYQISSQAQSLQGLISYHDEHRCGQGRNYAGRQPLSQPPDALLHQQLLERLNNRWSSLHLEQTVEC